MQKSFVMTVEYMRDNKLETVTGKFVGADAGGIMLRLANAAYKTIFAGAIVSTITEKNQTPEHLLLDEDKGVVVLPPVKLVRP